jgi:F0F1-type ATP synthase assembly protein I
MGVTRKKGSIIIFILYIIVGLPVGLEPILTKAGELAYFSELDNWVGTYLLVVLGLIEVLVAGWLMKKKSLDEMNNGAYWKVPKWFHVVFIKFLTPISIIVLLVFSTKDYISKGYFNLIPESISKISTENAVPWFLAARIVVICMLVIGFIQAYTTIKRKYGTEITTGKTVVRM